MKQMIMIIVAAWIAAVAFKSVGYAFTDGVVNVSTKREGYHFCDIDDTQMANSMFAAVGDINDSDRVNNARDDASADTTRGSENDGSKESEEKVSEPVKDDSSERQKSSKSIANNTGKDLFITKDRNEHVGFIFSYGGFFPVADYSARYKAAHLFSAAIPVYYVNFFGISPEVHVRYTKLDSKPSYPNRTSTMSIVQLFPALVYRYNITLPGSFSGPFTVFGRIYDGLAMIEYKSGNLLEILFGQDKIIEYINVFGISAGCTLTVYQGFFIGVESGYSFMATAGTPLQSVSFMINAGYKF
ncbi:MAG TPA: hypothetical protein PLM53_20085 [Spirochaetota bacterium]|nr:hypothetical protein [Spirochaetota bacterium]HQF10466.1 hypothetical protein [Spirochaetota bacterium]HQH99394.1 hypothetical protein [Spirochaetota bacterium]HQJ72885.1 hypothetical protein [Spirochaetota bacterium]